MKEKIAPSCENKEIAHTHTHEYTHTHTHTHIGVNVAVNVGTVWSGPMTQEGSDQHRAISPCALNTLIPLAFEDINGGFHDT